MLGEICSPTPVPLGLCLSSHPRKGIIMGIVSEASELQGLRDAASSIQLVLAENLGGTVSLNDMGVNRGPGDFPCEPYHRIEAYGFVESTCLWIFKYQRKVHLLTLTRSLVHSSKLQVKFGYTMKSSEILNIIAEIPGVEEIEAM